LWELGKLKGDSRKEMAKGEPAHWCPGRPLHALEKEYRGWLEYRELKELNFPKINDQ
jgi:hypothetical protein